MATHKLSDHFWRHEFECHGEDCCSHSCPVNAELLEHLETLRAIAGGHPLVVTSGFRCLTHNRNIGSADTSQHPLGLAADVKPPRGLTPEEFAEIAKQIDAFDQGGIGVYDTFVHLDIRSTGRARWDGRTK